MAKMKRDSAEEPIETQLWKAADTLRKNIDAAVYKHIVLGLVFLKYSNDAFMDLYGELKGDSGECTNIFPITSLTTLRDTLLPKSMSGEVRVELKATAAHLS